MILTLLGGIGIFLVGMILLSDGLKAAAGGALRSILERFARTPLRAILSGAGVTALVQSSSATTLTTIGFVSAGLLTFPQAVGLILGANLGTTSTGWLVSLIGLKVNVATLALPLVGVGALMSLLGRGRWTHGGMALAGFGLIFVGIDVLQTGMESVADRIDPSVLPGPTLLGALVLVLAGAALTVVMQSSSAAVATTLTALHAGGIGLEQAALLVIGQNLGTSVKAVLAAIGGGVPVRRTAAAHVLFNVITAGLALLLLPLLLRGALVLVGPDDPAVAIAVFHSAFNLLGVLVLFPVLGRFAALVERLIPERRPLLTRNLDPSVARVPEVAVEAARRSTLRTAEVLLLDIIRRGEGERESTQEPDGRTSGTRSRDGGRARVGAEGKSQPPTKESDAESAWQPPTAPVSEVPEALAEIRHFLSHLAGDPNDPGQFARHLSVLHALDHLDRLVGATGVGSTAGPAGGTAGGAAGRTAGDTAGGTTAASDPADIEGRMASVFRSALPLSEGSSRMLATFSRDMAELRKSRRTLLLEEVAAGRIGVEEGRLQILQLKEADRIAYHAWRAAHHLEQADSELGGRAEDNADEVKADRAGQGRAVTGDAEADEGATGEVAEAAPKPSE